MSRFLWGVLDVLLKLWLVFVHMLAAMMALLFIGAGEDVKAILPSNAELWLPLVIVGGPTLALWGGVYGLWWLFGSVPPILRGELMRRPGEGA